MLHLGKIIRDVVWDELGFEEQYDGFEPALNDPFQSEALINEEEAGKRIVKNLLKGDRGHFGPT
jgi:hypothetical protein